MSSSSGFPPFSDFLETIFDDEALVMHLPQASIGSLSTKTSSLSVVLTPFLLAIAAFPSHPNRLPLSPQPSPVSSSSSGPDRLTSTAYGVVSPVYEHLPHILSSLFFILLHSLLNDAPRHAPLHAHPKRRRNHRPSNPRTPRSRCPSLVRHSGND